MLGVEVKDWNRRNYQELLSIQEGSGEGCLPTAIYGAAAKLVDRPLEEAHHYREVMRDKLKDCLNKGNYLVRREDIYKALESTCSEVDIAITRITLNEQGQALIGNFLGEYTVRTNVIPGFNPLAIENVEKPCVSLLLQAGGGESHYVMEDGSEESQQMVDHYLAYFYERIAVFEVEALGGDRVRFSSQCAL